MADSLIQEIDAKIATLLEFRQKWSGINGIESPVELIPLKASTPAPKKKVISPETRKRMSEMQKAKWAERKAKAAGHLAPPTPSVRGLRARKALSSGAN